MELLQQLSVRFESLTDVIIAYSLLLAGVGLASMAILDALKGAFSLKEYFHRYMIKRWIARSRGNKNKEYIKRSLRDLEDEMAATRNPAKESSTFRYLNPFTLKSERAVYALDTPKLMAKLQVAAETTILLGCASSDARISLVKKYNEPGVIPSDNDQIERKDKIRELNNSLDTLQIQLLYTWGKLNRFAALCIGASLMYQILSPLLGGIPLIVFSLFGGALAPFAKQLLVSFRQIKRL